MPVDKVTFNQEWYNNLISSSDEKNILLDKFKEIIGKSYKSCLEIGLGTTTHFTDALAKYFEKYVVVEKEDIKVTLPQNVEFINDDWEKVQLNQKFDVIIASHVIYYFDNKKTAIQKMLDSLTTNGIIIFVVNGKDADYGPLKTKFSELVKQQYIFTYDELKNILSNKDYEEHSIPSRIKFKKPSDLFETLKLSFDQYPDEYTALQNKMNEYFESRFSNKNYLTINQKIFVVKNNPWEKLLRHEPYELVINGTSILVHDKVFTPDPTITYSSSLIVNHLPDLKGKKVLDIGCGTGIIGINCIKNKAKMVLFADNDTNAINNTKANLQLNNLTENFQIINSNLFEKIPGKFNYIFANLPILDEVWQSNNSTPNIALQFLTQCKKHIEKNGKVFFCWASFSDIEHIKSSLNDLNYNYKIIQEEKLGFTWYLIEISF